MTSQLDRREEIFVIVFNSTNIVQTPQNNIYKYNFPVGSIKLDKSSKIALASVNMYNSVFNIATYYGNNTFSLIIPVGAGSTTLNLIVPNGIYSVADLNSFIQFSLIQAGIGYLIDANGNYVYYCEILENQARYSIQFNGFACPTTLAAGWSNVGGWTLPTTTRTPQLVVNTAGFSTWLGFPQATYPTVTQTTNYSHLSDLTPNVNPVSSIIVLCSIISNNYSIPSQVISSFTFGSVSAGQLLDFSPPQLSWTSAKGGSYDNIVIRLVDENFNDVYFNDTNSLITFNISNSYENVQS